MQKLRMDMLINKNAVVDKGDGVVEFKGGLTLSDESVQKNGTRYDIKSMDIDQFDGTVFADHDYGVQAIVGNALGVAKKGKKLVAQGVQFAVNQSPLAQFVYEMVKAGFIKSVSIGTMGRLDMVDDEQNPDEEAWGIYRNARLLEFSFVGIPNNDNAQINSIAKNVFEHAKSEGMKTDDLEDYLKRNDVEVEMPAVLVKKPPASDPPKPPEKDTNSNKDESMKFVTITNGRDFEIAVTYKNASDKEVTLNLAPGMSVDVSEEQKEAVEKQINGATAPKKQDDQPDVKEMVKSAIDEAVKPLEEQLKVYKDAFDKSAEEPEFVTTPNGLQPSGGTVRLNKEGFESMDSRELTALQIQSAWKLLKQHDTEAGETLTKINNFNKECLIEKGFIKRNSIGLTDFGNFVTNPELLTDIQGFRSDYSQVLSAFPYQETSSLRMAWLSRNGDIDMQPVGMEPTDSNADANLKPVSSYTATPDQKDLEELAAVTPIASAATIFLAADLVDDATQGYRHSYDRNLARGVVAALQQAVEANGSSTGTTSVGFNVSGSQTAAEQLEDIRQAIFTISQGEGTLLLNEASWGMIWSLLTQSGNGAAVVDMIQNGNRVMSLWNRSVAIAPNDLMPTLGQSDYKTYAIDGSNVDITHAVFYANPTNFKGRQHGGLNFDVSDEAAYEENGVVKSAYQRNEIVLRGSHFRGAAVPNPSRVAGVRAQNLLTS